MVRTVRALAVSLVTASMLAACAGHGHSSVPPTSPTATPEPTATPTSGSDATAYECPTSDSTSSVARTAGHLIGDATRKPARSRTKQLAQPTTQLLSVMYASSTAQRGATSLAQNEKAVGANLVHTLTFSHLGKVAHIVAVAPGQAASVEASLKQLPGVVSVSTVGRRRVTTVTTPSWTNDPYFDGFTNAQNIAEENPAPSTFEVLPYAESGSVPGQWDMHVIGLGQAFAYSQANNGSGLPANAGALGSSSVKVAIIDTGEDPTHPELSSKIVYQRCFITNELGTAQSTSDYEIDQDGHGTDVAGIAAADTNNGLGFTGAGGNVVLYGYRVFPTPDDTCESADADDQCDASTADIASAIEDAVAQHVNVISMSLGGYINGENQGCTSPGVDGDTTEGAAVADAIAANVIVTAAAGNDGLGALEAPGCDAGVIAVGASALDDGEPDGSNHTGGTATNPVEYVASYSDYGSPAAAFRSTSAWGIVAPGGDPADSEAQVNAVTYDWHWIENIWTSTPYMANSGDQTFQGNCAADYGATTVQTADCRTLIAGTSMATPHVGGVAALILSATGGSSSPYQSPAEMKQLLCESTDDIGDPHEGCGRLNVYRAMALALGDPTAP